MAQDSPMMSNQDRLIYMANQIARNFATMDPARAADAVADHIASFWDPRMRAQIFELQEKGDERVGPVAAAAITILRQSGAPPHQTQATEFNSVSGVGHSDAG